ncbi:IS1595 family transposase [Paramagnetospirillum caucaseum]|nr:IS1595 family transposase [Paramagnetospirillum caucaseum]
MNDRPQSLTAFLRRFPDDAACASYLHEKRWPDGFVCPACGACKGWELSSKRWTWECGECGRQTSVTAGTVMHRSKVSLRTWFLAAHIMATHSNGMSALQMQAHLGLGSYKTAWLLLHKLRRAMVNPERDLLVGDVEVDETTLPYRTKRDPVGGGQGRSTIGKMVVVGAVELLEGNAPGRIRLETVPDYSGSTLKGFIRDVVEPRSEIWTDGNESYAGMTGYSHHPRVIGNMAAHILMPWIHRVFSNLKRWAMGTYHGLRKKHIASYLDEFVFRWNRRRWRQVAFDKLLGLSVRIPPMGYRELVEG